MVQVIEGDPVWRISCFDNKEQPNFITRNSKNIVKFFCYQFLDALFKRLSMKGSQRYSQSQYTMQKKKKKCCTHEAVYLVKNWNDLLSKVVKKLAA